jgi:hypothetical protein
MLVSRIAPDASISAMPEDSARRLAACAANPSRVARGRRRVRRFAGPDQPQHLFDRLQELHGARDELWKGCSTIEAAPSRVADERRQRVKDEAVARHRPDQVGSRHRAGGYVGRWSGPPAPRRPAAWLRQRPHASGRTRARRPDRRGCGRGARPRRGLSVTAEKRMPRLLTLHMAIMSNGRCGRSQQASHHVGDCRAFG